MSNPINSTTEALRETIANNVGAVTQPAPIVPAMPDPMAMMMQWMQMMQQQQAQQTAALIAAATAPPTPPKSARTTRKDAPTTCPRLTAQRWTGADGVPMLTLKKSGSRNGIALSEAEWALLVANDWSAIAADLVEKMLKDKTQTELTHNFA